MTEIKDPYELFDECMKKKFEENRRIMIELFSEPRLDQNAKVVITLNHATTNETSETKNNEDQPRASSSECTQSE